MDGMTSTEFSVAGMHCGSCAVVVRRTLSKIPGIHRVDVREGSGSVTVDYKADEVTPHTIAQAIAEKGYSVSAPGLHIRATRPSFLGAFRSFFSDPSFFAERQAAQYGIISTIVLGFLYTFILRGLFPGAGARTGILALYLVISFSAVGATLWHFLSFRRQVNCMTGMMAGMTIGMISGFLTGTIVAASNGIFMGTVYGMVAGMAIGSYAGRCCGVMGIMEGMMAGLMSGVMGGMIPLMFLSENIMLFLPILTTACLLILGGLIYSISWENREYQKASGRGPEWKPLGFTPFLTLLFFIIFVTILIMVLGPKSALVVQFG